MLLFMVLTSAALFGGKAVCAAMYQLLTMFM